MPELCFVVCKCLRHATFMNPQGASGPDVCSKREARAVLDRALSHEAIAPSEAQNILSQIQGSPLPETPEEVPEEIRDQVRQWTLMRSTTNGRLDFADFHDYFPLV